MVREAEQLVNKRGQRVNGQTSLTLYNCGEQKCISKCTTHLAAEWATTIKKTHTHAGVYSCPVRTGIWDYNGNRNLDGFEDWKKTRRWIPMWFSGVVAYFKYLVSTSSFGKLTLFCTAQVEGCFIYHSSLFLSAQTFCRPNPETNSHSLLHMGNLK